MICLKCGYSNDRPNTYGTFCSQCGEFNTPIKKADIWSEMEQKDKALKDYVMDKLKRKIGEKDADRNR